MASPLFLALGAGAGVIGIGAYLSGLAQLRLRKIIECTPASEAIFVSPGLTEISGRAAYPDHDRPKAPFAMKDCVYYHTSLFKAPSSSDGSASRELVASFCSGDLIAIEDETGSVLVRLELVGKGRHSTGGSGISPRQSLEEYLLKTERAFRERPATALTRIFGKFKSDSAFDSFLQRNAPDCMNYPGRLEIEETVIYKGDPLIAIGRAIEIDEGEGAPSMLIEKDRKNGIFVIADGFDRSSLHKPGLLPGLMAYFGPIIAGAGAAAAIAGLSSQADPFPASLLSLAAMAFVASLLYAHLLAAMLNEKMKGAIAMRNGLLRARANLAALCNKRALLIKKIAKFIGHYAKREKNIHAELQALSKSQSSRAGELLKKIAGKYPEMQSDVSFSALLSELQSAEGGIAAGNKCAADRESQYGSLLTRFPYSTFAPLFGLSAIQHQ